MSVGFYFAGCDFILDSPILNWFTRLYGTNNNYYNVVIFFGIIAGLGGSIVNISSVTILNYYFTESELSLTNGVGSGGCGLGAFVFAWAYLYVFPEWREAFKMVGVISSVLTVLCAFFYKTDGKDIQSDEKLNEKFDEKFLHDSRTPMFFTILRKLVTNWVFYLLIASDFLSWLVQPVPFSHLKHLEIKDLNNSTASTSNLLAYYGIFSGSGKIVFGILCTKSFKYWKLSPLVTFIIAQIVFGIVIILMPFAEKNMLLLSLTSIAAFMSGAYSLVITFTSSLMTNVHEFTVCYSFMLTMEAIGTFIGPPLVGYVYEVQSSYKLAFSICGMVLVVSGAVLVFLIKKERFKTKSYDKSVNDSIEVQKLTF